MEGKRALASRTAANEKILPRDTKNSVGGWDIQRLRTQSSQRAIRLKGFGFSVFSTKIRPVGAPERDAEFDWAGPLFSWTFAGTQALRPLCRTRDGIHEAAAAVHQKLEALSRSAEALDGHVENRRSRCSSPSSSPSRSSPLSAIDVVSSRFEHPPPLPLLPLGAPPAPLALLPLNSLAVAAC